MSFNDPEYLRKMYPEMFHDNPLQIWLSLILLLAIFLILPYLFLRLQERYNNRLESKIKDKFDELEWRFRSF